MQSSATTPEAYIAELPEDRKEAITKLRSLIKSNLPEGFKEVMYYGMISYVVPHEIYPKGYHVDPKVPLPFMSLASQKNHIAVYHSGVYADDSINKWFVERYAEAVPGKLNMGKSCIRFSNPKKIPFELIGELSSKMTVEEWIKTYENALSNRS